MGLVQARLDIPCGGTTHSDYFYGPIPCARYLTQEEIDTGYELNIGISIVETFETRHLNPVFVQEVICASHGPFVRGKADDAVCHAVVLEEVAKMALYTCIACGKAKPAPEHCVESTLPASTAPMPIMTRKSERNKDE